MACSYQTIYSLVWNCGPYGNHQLVIYCKQLDLFLLELSHEAWFSAVQKRVHTRTYSKYTVHTFHSFDFILPTDATNKFTRYKTSQTFVLLECSFKCYLQKGSDWLVLNHSGGSIRINFAFQKEVMQRNLSLVLIFQMLKNTRGSPTDPDL